MCVHECERCSVVCHVRMKLFFCLVCFGRAIITKPSESVIPIVTKLETLLRLSVKKKQKTLKQSGRDPALTLELLVKLLWLFVYTAIFIFYLPVYTSSKHRSVGH